MASFIFIRNHLCIDFQISTQVGTTGSRECTNAESPRKGNLTPGTLPVTSRPTQSGSERGAYSLLHPLCPLACPAFIAAPTTCSTNRRFRTPAAMLTPLAAALLVLPASPAPRLPPPRPGPSRRARPAVVRAAALRALPRRLELWSPRLAAVESNPPPPSSASPAPDEERAGSGGSSAAACWIVGCSRCWC